MAGFLLGAHESQLPVVLDGFPCSAAALIARSLEPRVLETAFFSHRSQGFSMPRCASIVKWRPLRKPACLLLNQAEIVEPGSS